METVESLNILQIDCRKKNLEKKLRTANLSKELRIIKVNNCAFNMKMVIINSC